MEDVEFAEQTVLEVLVPENLDLDVEEALQSAATHSNEANESSLWSSIAERDLIFFGAPGVPAT